MRFVRYTSVLSVMVVCSMNSLYANAAPAPKPVYMTSQIQRLLNEKQEKISKLEECDGKRKGFMIAGISTLGLTAVGVGVNIAQASKSNKLSNQIEEQNRQLEKQQANLADINSQISEKQNENKRRECEGDPTKIYVNGQCLDRAPYECAQNPNKEWKDGQCVDKVKPENPSQPHDYSGYTLDCAHTKFEFIVGSDYQAVLQRLNNQCKTDTGVEMVEVLREKTTGGKIVYECKGYAQLAKCSEGGGNEGGGNEGGGNEGGGNGGDELQYDGIIGRPCSSTEANAVWTADGDKKCLPSEGATNTVPCTCKKPADITPDPVNLPDRIIGKPCKKSDLPAHATAGKYALNGSLQCLEAEGSTDVVTCQCSITKCDGSKGYDLKDGKCQIQESHVCDAAKHLVCKDAACTGCICEDNYVTILHGNGDCVKRDYLKTDKCTCQDGTKACSLVADLNGTFVCQTSKGWGEKCKCESCPKGMSFDPGTQKCVNCITGYNEALKPGCVCDSSKGLVELYVTSIGGKRTDQKTCGCGAGETWWYGKCEKR